jgi:Mn2+/Fe2+ NRAMP family transporter
LSREPSEAKAFYAAIAIATLLGSAILFSHLDPIKALVWSAVINGVLAAPVMVLLMLMCVRRDIMGSNAITGPIRWIGWIATGVMTVAVLAMVTTSFV